MNWVQLTATKELEQLKELSKNNLILIFKHSTKCGTSRTVLSRFERAWREEEMKKVAQLLGYTPVRLGFPLHKGWRRLLGDGTKFGHRLRVRITPRVRTSRLVQLKTYVG